jgi:hypothetical protein
MNPILPDLDLPPAWVSPAPVPGLLGVTRFMVANGRFIGEGPNFNVEFTNDTNSSSGRRNSVDLIHDFNCRRFRAISAQNPGDFSPLNQLEFSRKTPAFREVPKVARLLVAA